MIDTICKVVDRYNDDGKEYFKLFDNQSRDEYIVPLTQLFDDNLVVGSEYKFYKTYNSKIKRYFIIQEHPYYKLEKTYDFHIIRREYNKINGKIDAFVIVDNKENEIRINSLHWQAEKWDKEFLSCQVIAYKKTGLVLRNNDFFNLPYEIGKIYEFKVLGFGELKDKKDQTFNSVILENYDGSEISVSALKWQNEKLWKFPTLFCEVLKYNSAGIPHLRNRDERHPIFKVGQKYDFKVMRLKTRLDVNDKKHNIIEVEGADNCLYETIAFPGQMRTIQTNDNLECIVTYIGFNIKLIQYINKDPFFSSVDEIVKDKTLIKKYFDYAISNKEDEDSIELATKYESNSAFWIFTFCNKVLPKYFKGYSDRYDYKSCKQVADLIICFENFIIKNGIIASFPDEKARKNTLLKAKQQLDKYIKIKEVITILDEFGLNDFFKKERSEADHTNIEEIYYLLQFSDINQIDLDSFLTYLTNTFKQIKYFEKIKYNLLQLDKIIQLKKQIYYNNEYEKSFNFSFKNNDLFENESFKDKYFTWSFCQYLINEKLENFERANYIIGKILRQHFYYSSGIELKEKILLNAYFFQNNQNNIIEHPFEYSDRLILNEQKLHENPNCCNGQSDSWLEIKDSFENNSVLIVNVIEKQFNGFIVVYKGIKGYLPKNHIVDRNLKNYSHSKIDFTISVQCMLLSEEFNFYITKQSDLDSDGFICINNLMDQVKVGDIIEGQIKSIEHYGVFVTNYWGVGLLHRTYISSNYWDKESLSTYFRIGDSITTKVIGIEEKGINLSLKDLIGTSEEEIYFDFINYVNFGDVFVKESSDAVSDDILNEGFGIKINQLEKALCFEQFATLKNDLDDKIHYLRLSKQFFSSINNPRSYLINIYTNYFKLLKLIEEVINSFSLEKVCEIKQEAQIILEKIKLQQQTLEVYPDSKKLIFFINIISLFNDTTDSGINTLFEMLHQNSDQKILTTITKITLANNLLISESQEYTDFVRKNLSHIKSYLDEGVLSLKETETDKRERELREKLKYWKGRILEDEGETQEFKSTFRTPLPNEKRLQEKAKLQEALVKAPNNNAILKKIDAIDGELASKRVIHSSLKTLCAFANTNGGTLLIGVADDKSILGLEIDYFNMKNKQNRDGFGLFFDDKIKEYFEPSFSTLLERDFLKFPEGDVLIVNVKQSVDAVFLLKDEEGLSCEELYIRDLSSTKEIKEKRELVKFVKQKEKEQIKIKIDG